MALATQEDVEDRLPRDLEDEELERLESLLDDASALVIGYVGQDFEPSPYPAPVAGVVAQMVVRYLLVPDVSDMVGVESETTGPFSRRFAAGASNGGPWLAATDKLALRPYRRGVTSVGMYGPRYEVT